ncbi:unnamed protein product [Mytilus coruscus]|uniref:Uncharacterized protein n=1 Tax=Mytilus coruscus TaxID=42192 RepID=A0A6J8C5V5_MYTCO|nr:unnamed protein product [Mytilus coruscus]
MLYFSAGKIDFINSLVAAFVLQVCCGNPGVHVKKACQFASSCVCKKVLGSELLVANCADKNLFRIPKVPNIVQDLSLQKNYISIIKDGIFEENILLKSLDLSFNRLKQIRKNSFKGLNNLLYLDLSNNDLNYENVSFESAAFYFLENLKSLHLKKNVNTSFVPDLSKLQSLKTLSMDFISDEIAILDEKYVSLKNLTFIDLSGFTGNCKMNILTHETFLFLPQITHLNISKCKIQYIHIGTFTNMKNISELDVSLNTCLGFPALENITTDLQNSAIKILKVNYIHGIFAMSIILKTSHIWYLNKTSLVRFEAAGNRIQRIESGALEYFPDSFESGNFRDNVFSIGEYMFDLMSMCITFLDVSESFSSHNVLTSYTEECIDLEDTVTMKSENNWIDAVSLYLKTKSSDFDFNIPVPHKLKTF